MLAKVLVVICLTFGSLVLTACQKQAQVKQKLESPDYNDVMVHDPSIIKAEDYFYIVGSHAMFAKSQDLMSWEQLSDSIATDVLFENVRKELAEDFSYAKTNTMWASDITQLKDGRYYLYYCLCEGSSPLSVLGVAVSDKVEGPYKKIKSILYSGTSPQFNRTYDATKDPNVIDPHVFYDNEERLWMVYGSYSGGIYILELDDKTGLPIDENTYGQHLMGGNHSRIEAPYIQYNHQTGYYYLFTSFGGLTADGGYNIRVSRSKSPDGPYEDYSGKKMADAKGKHGTIFDDVSIQDFGTKLIGNFVYEADDGLTNAGYVSPGHNSTYYDAESDTYFIIFHSRFPNGGERHEVRVHQMLFSEDGWPLIVPFRYNKEIIDDYQPEQLGETYKVISFSKEISDWITEPSEITLEKNGTIKGAFKGKWALAKQNSKKDSSIELDGKVYKGKFISVWNEYEEQQVMAFTGLSSDGAPLYLIEKRSK